MNALPQLAAANVNCRVLPDDSIEYVQGALQKVVSDDQVSIKMVGEASIGPASPMRPGCVERRHPYHQPDLAGRAGGANYGHGRDRWESLADRGHSNLWRSGVFHGQERHPLSRAR